MSKKAVNLDDFDATKESAQAHTFEVKETDGITGTGLRLKVLGAHADIVTEHQSRVINDIIRETEYAKKRGKTPDAKSIEEIREGNIKGAMVRIVGWEGATTDFDQAVMERALRRNPHWIDQVIEQSNDLGNFPRPQRPT